MIKDMESAMNIIKAILYFDTTQQIPYYTKLQLLLFITQKNIKVGEKFETGFSIRRLYSPDRGMTNFCAF